MGKSSVANEEKVSTVDRNIDQLRKQLSLLKEYLRAEPSPSALAEFDARTEEYISEIMGSSSPMNDAYTYATVGEATGLMNMAEEGLEGSTHESQRETLRQRQRVLENCLADLETRRAAESQQSRRSQPSGPQVADYMSKTLRAVTMDTTLKEVGRIFQERKIGSLLVQSGEEYIGCITETELSREVVGGDVDPATTTVKTCMREPLITIDTSDSMVEAVRLMKDKATRHLAVTEHDRIVGIVSVSDILRYYSGV